MSLFSVGVAASALVIANAAAQTPNSADLERGRQVFETKCGTCHTDVRGAEDAAGPNLFGVVGRPPASRRGFAYSPEMRRLTGVWTTSRLDEFLREPQTYLPGTFMAFTGVKRDGDRAALIAYLNSLHN